MNVEELYNRFLSESNRLYPNDTIQNLAIDFIYFHISDDEGGIKLFIKGIPVFNIQLLKQSSIVYDKTLNVVNYMTKSKDSKEFESYIKRGKKEYDKDFDEILGKLLKVNPNKKK